MIFATAPLAGAGGVFPTLKMVACQVCRNWIEHPAQMVLGDNGMTIIFELSKDARMLGQYYEIREQCFRAELGVALFDGSEDHYDRSGDILIARDGRRCVGGVRICGKMPWETARIPLEDEGVDLAGLFTELNLDNVSYCQWSRLALAPQYRGMDVVKDFCRALINTCLSLGYRLAFNVSGRHRARLYQRLHSSLGYHYQTYRDKRVGAEPGFADLEHLISVAFLSNVKPKVSAYPSGIDYLIDQKATSGHSQWVPAA